MTWWLREGEGLAGFEDEINQLGRVHLFSIFLSDFVCSPVHPVPLFCSVFDVCLNYIYYVLLRGPKQLGLYLTAYYTYYVNTTLFQTPKYPSFLLFYITPASTMCIRFSNPAKWCTLSANSSLMVKMCVTRILRHYAGLCNNYYWTEQCNETGKLAKPRELSGLINRSHDGGLWMREEEKMVYFP